MLMMWKDQGRDTTGYGKVKFFSKKNASYSVRGREGKRGIYVWRENCRWKKPSRRSLGVNSLKMASGNEKREK